MDGDLPLVATYRLQLTPEFTLADATRIVPYLAELGISHVYTSSYLQAAAGSTHGYDTTDHATVNVELGGDAALTEFHAALRRHHMGNVVDVVPNHMSVADPAANRRWWNVLREGPSSPDAAFFDIDWNPPESKLRDKVLLPILGDDYAHELAAGSIRLDTEQREIDYNGIRFPLAPDTEVPPDGDVHTVLEQQHYRLAHWRLGRDELDYRRFFDVTTLAGVRVEEPWVFDAVHERTLAWVRHGDVQGLRIDHPDGLRDPGGYLVRLRDAAPDAWIVVEKILEPGEQLRDDWPVDGTTGYDTMARLTGVFVESSAESTLTDTYTAFVGDDRSYEEHVLEVKRLVARTLFGAEITRLTTLVAEVADQQLELRDFSRADIHAAIESLLVAMPVYRTYVSSSRVSDEDAAVLKTTLERAKELTPEVDATLLDALAVQLRGETPQTAEIAARFQQLSGPVMAKGIEDTAFYRYNRLICLNEVGADPGTFGASVEAFHDECERAARERPRSMSATSTHDTKRSEDVRAWIALLSEAPDEWRDMVERWRAMNERRWADATPDRNVEYLLYQTLFATGALPSDRLREYLTKAMREAKVTTSWLRPTEAEATTLAFAEAVNSSADFLADLTRVRDGFEPAARLAIAAQLTLKTMGPGVPDFYQGTELPTFSLVDPDNRRPVDFDARSRLLASKDHGEYKLDLTQRLIALRRSRAEAFVGPDASYQRVQIEGDRADGTVAFLRGADVLAAVTVRPLATARHGWGATSIELPPGRWSDVLGDRGAFEGRLVVGEAAVEGCVALMREAPG
jgi:(1->4)-alpha-D-glucan 1-alpha-D-glucosylmutase